MTENDLPDIKGKAIYIQLSPAGNDFTWTLLGMGFERQGGKLFLIGRTFQWSANDAPSHWDGGRVCVAWDMVAYYVLFESPDHMRSAWERKWRSQETRTPSWWEKLFLGR
jgi:hypothetical protein